MKTITFLLSLVFVSSSIAQIEIPAEKWQEDLKFLQRTVHNDYPFLFKKTTAAEFDKRVESLHEQIPNLKEHEIAIGLARLVSSFEYGHTALSLRGTGLLYHQLPINFYQFKDGVFVEGVHKDHQEILGAKLLAVESMPVEKALLAIRPVVPAENDQFVKAYGLSFLGIPEVLHAQGITKSLKSSVTLSLQKDGKRFQYEMKATAPGNIPTLYGFLRHGGNWVSARGQAETPHYLKHLEKIYYFEYLPDSKTVYVRHSQIQDEKDDPIPEFYQRVFEFVDKNDVDRLVLDVRLNGGGNNYKNKPIVTGIIESKKINQTGKLFVIIGRRTFSACQNLVNELDNYTNAIFVGEPTAENVNFYGDNRTVVLPNSKIPVRLSFAWWQDKPQWENGPWTAPHVAMETTFGEYQSNQDPVLAAALNFSGDNFVLDPMEYLTNLFQTNQLEKLTEESKRMVEDPAYRFFDFEGRFNQTGYKLLGESQIEPAIFVFLQNTKLFPKSANAWDSLGEAYLKAGLNDKARGCFQKAIALDPLVVGLNSQKMLDKIPRSTKNSSK